MQPRVYVGYDSREVNAYRVCVSSMRAHASVHPLIMPVSATMLGAAYRRPTEMRGGVRYDTISGEPMSTDFSLARFFVPAIARRGWALFCDCDFLWRGDVNELFERADSRYAVMVVKHKHVGSDSIKMDNQPQTYYHRKNWSSLMLLNCDAHECQALTPDVLNTATKHWLHGFNWVFDDDRIGSLDLTWNWLAGISPPMPHPPGPKVVHHTLGIPEMKGYEDVPYADEWRKYARG
jgi:hypothetical protein